MPSFFDSGTPSWLIWLICFLTLQEGKTQTLTKHFRLDQPHAGIVTAPYFNERIGNFSETKDRFGKNGAAMECYGSGGFKTDAGPHTPLLTATVWIKLPQNLSPGNKVIFARNYCAGNLAAYGLGISNNQLYFTWGNGVQNSQVTTPLPSADLWHMITASYDGQQARLYLDGIQVAISPVSTIAMVEAISGFTIGFGLDNCQPANYFVGAIDDIKLYAGVMSQAQILAQYLEGGCAPDPVKTLPLDGNALAYPSSNSTSNSGAVPATDRFNHPSGAMKFDGVNGFISLNESFHNFSEASIAAWIKLEGNSTEPNAIVSSDSIHKFVHFQAASFPTEMAVFVNPAGVITLPVPAITPGQWVHLALTVKSGSQKVFLNGAEVSSANQVFTSIANANLLRIGSGLLNGRFFKGSIDHVTLYDRALTPEQVRYDKTIFDRIAFYPFTNHAHDLELGNNGTVTGGSFVEDRFGQPASAYRTQGSSGTIRIPHSIQYEWMRGFSVSYWVKTNALSSFSYIRKGMGNPYPGDTFGMFFSEISSTEINFSVGGQNYDYGAVGVSYSPFGFSDNHWHHVVGTFNGARANLYIDGIWVTGSDNDFPLAYLNNNKKPIVIGSGNASVDFDDVQIFRRALSQDEVQALFSPAGCQVTAPTIANTGGLTFCLGDSVILTSSEVHGNLWNTGDTTQRIVVKSNGNFAVRTRNEPCISLVSEPVPVVVNQVPAKPLIFPSGPLTFCQGGSVTLSTNAGPGHRWSNGATSQSITVTASGTFTDTAKVAGCQSVSDSVSVTVNPLPVVFAGEDVAIPSGDSTTLVATGAITYQWSPLTGLFPPAGNAATVIAKPIQSTVYTVTGKDENQCSASDNVMVTVSGTTGLLKLGMDSNPIRTIQVIPNPSASGVFQVVFPESGDETVSYSVLAMDGKEIQKGTMTTRQPSVLDLGSFPPGLYQLKIQSQDRVLVLRVLKE